MRRWLLVGSLLVGGLSLAWVVALARGYDPIAPIRALIAGARPPIVVGLVHSQTGPLAISELSLIDAETMAVEELNAAGGVAGRMLKAEVADGRSDPATFAVQAGRLIEKSGASVLAGGWTSECRKSLVSVVEQKNSLLIFPANFEGLETSPNLIYSGGSANQVVLPAVRWCFESLKARRFFIVGTEEVWSRVVSEIAKDAVKLSGGELVGEDFFPIVGGDFGGAVDAIRSAKPDVVLNMLVGDSNVSFYAAYRRAGLAADRQPILGFNVSEDELRRFPTGDVSGHYSGWSYFQSVDRPENVGFVRRFKARFGVDRVVSDSMVAAYNGLMIWARAADEADTADPKVVMSRFDRQSFDGPEGIVTIDPVTRTAWRPFYVGKARPDGQFDVVWSITKPIQPAAYVATRPGDRWRTLLGELKAKWSGRWSSSEAARPAADRPSK